MGILPDTPTTEEVQRIHTEMLQNFFFTLTIRDEFAHRLQKVVGLMGV